MKSNTYLAVNLKVKMFRDSHLKLGKDYIGVLCHDVPEDSVGGDDDHFTFTETYPMNVRKASMGFSRQEYWSGVPFPSSSFQFFWVYI